MTLFRDYGWTGPQLDIRTLDACVKVTGPTYVPLLSHIDDWYFLLTREKKKDMAMCNPRGCGLICPPRRSAVYSREFTYFMMFLYIYIFRLTFAST